MKWEFDIFLKRKAFFINTPCVESTSGTYKSPTSPESAVSPPSIWCVLSLYFNQTRRPTDCIRTESSPHSEPSPAGQPTIDNNEPSISQRDQWTGPALIYQLPFEFYHPFSLFSYYSFVIPLLLFSLQQHLYRRVKQYETSKCTIYTTNRIIWNELTTIVQRLATV